MPWNHNVVLLFMHRISDGVATGVWSSSVLSNYISLMDQGDDDFGNEKVGIAQAIQGTFLLATAIPAAWLASRLRRDSILKGMGLVAYLAIATTAGALLYYTGNQQYIVLCAALALWGIAQANSPVLDALFADSVPTGRRAALYTSAHICYILSQGLGPAVAALLFYFKGDEWSLPLMQQVMLSGMVLALVPATLLLLFNDDKALGEESEGLLKVIRSRDKLANDEEAGLEQPLLNNWQTDDEHDLEGFDTPAVHSPMTGQDLFAQALSPSVSGTGFQSPPTPTRAAAIVAANQAAEPGNNTGANGDGPEFGVLDPESFAIELSDDGMTVYSGRSARSSLSMPLRSPARGPSPLSSVGYGTDLVVPAVTPPTLVMPPVSDDAAVATTSKQAVSPAGTTAGSVQLGGNEQHPSTSAATQQDTNAAEQPPDTSAPQMSPSSTSQSQGRPYAGRIQFHLAASNSSLDAWLPGSASGRPSATSSGTMSPHENAQNPSQTLNRRDALGLNMLEARDRLTMIDAREEPLLEVAEEEEQIQPTTLRVPSLAFPTSPAVTSPTGVVLSSPPTTRNRQETTTTTSQDTRGHPKLTIQTAGTHNRVRNRLDPAGNHQTVTVSPGSRVTAMAGPQSATERKTNEIRSVQNPINTVDHKNMAAALDRVPLGSNSRLAARPVVRQTRRISFDELANKRVCGCLSVHCIPAVLALTDMMMGLASGMTINHSASLPPSVACLVQKVQLHVPDVFMVFIVGSGIVLWVFFAVGFFPIFFREHVQLSPVYVNLMYCFVPLCLSSMSAFAQYQSRFIGKAPTMALNRAIGIALLYWIALHTDIWDQPLIMVPVYVVRTSIMNANYPLQRSILMDYVSKENRAKWASLESVTSFGWSGSAALGGWLIHRYGFQLTFLVTASMQLLGWLCSLLLLPIVPIRDVTVSELSAVSAASSAISGKR